MVCPLRIKTEEGAFDVSLTSLLSLLRENSLSLAFVKHVMSKVKDTVAYFNPSRAPVIAANIFKGKVDTMEMACIVLKSITILKSSEWTAEIAASGTAGSHIKS